MMALSFKRLVSAFSYGQKKQEGRPRSQQRERFNPLTGKTEVISGTKAGKRRARLSFGDPLRTHDLRGPVGKKPTKAQRREEQ